MPSYTKNRPLTLSCFVALVVALAAWGCAKQEPISAANSGLKPAAGDGSSNSSGASSSDDKTTGGVIGKPRATDSDKPKPREPLTDAIANGNPPAAVADDFDYKIPAGSAADVVAYLSKVTERIHELLEQADSAGPDAAANLGVLLPKLFETRIKAAQMILDDEQASAEQRQLAAESAVSSLAELDRNEDPTASTRLISLARELEQDDSAEVRRLIAPFLLADELSRLQAKDSESPAKVIGHLKTVLDQRPEELGFQHLMVAQNTATTLIELQHPLEAAQVLRLVGERFADSPDPQVADGARQLASQAFIIEVDDPLRRVLAEKEGAKEDLLAAARTAIAGETIELNALQILQRVADHLQKEHPHTSTDIAQIVREGVDKLLGDEKVTAAELTEIVEWAQDSGQDAQLVQAASDKIVPAAQAEIARAQDAGNLAPALDEMLSEVTDRLEQAGRLDVAAGVCDAISAAIDASSDSAKMKSLQESLADAKRRRSLVGQPFTVAGVTLDGEPFDWKKYEGKVVLVDFWASWCGPCLAEIPNIYDNYEKYNKKGFEVVGVNMDDDLEDVTRLFASRGELPWPSVVSEDPALRGSKNPLVQSCGVSSIPFVVLVGQDGKVLDIHVRGEKLGEKLAELLGPPVEETEPDNTPPREAAPMPPTP